LKLGLGNNKLTIDTDPAVAPTGLLTRVNAGLGDDIVNIEKIVGHTYVNGGAGSDTINVSPVANRLNNLYGLLTVSGDNPQALTQEVVLGSAAQGTAVSGGKEIQQLTIDATGGPSALGFSSDANHAGVIGPG